MTSRFRDLPAPLPPGIAIRFGAAHARSILEQAVLGAHRTFPAWLLASAGLTEIQSRAGFTPTPRSTIGVAARTLLVAAGLQIAWPTGFAAFSGTRSAFRLASQGRESVLPLEGRDIDGQVVVASAHIAERCGSWYVDGVFAWPRGRGGGKAIVSRLLEEADRAERPLTLTALSPRVAVKYRKAGFRPLLWIYLMSREPGAGTDARGAGCRYPGRRVLGTTLRAESVR